MTRKQFSINMIAIMSSYGIALVINFVLSPYIIRHLGSAMYSYYSIANNFVQYLTIISIALNSMASRFITIEYSRGNTKQASVYFTSVFYGNIFLACVMIVPMIFIILNLKNLISISDANLYTVKVLFTLVFLATITNLFSSIFSVSTYVKNRLDLKAGVEIVTNIIKGSLLFLMYFFLQPSIVYLGIVVLIIAIICVIMYVCINKKIFPEGQISKKNFEIGAVKEIVSSGVWNSIQSLGGILLYSTDIYVANLLIGSEAGGSISIVHTIPTLFNGIISTITSVFLPSITWKYGRGEIDDMVEEVQYSQKILGCFASILVAIFFVFGYDFYELWVPGNNSKLLMILTVMTMAYIPFLAASWPVSNLNIIMNRTKTPAIMNIVNGCINVVSMFLLVKVCNLGIYVITLTTMIIGIYWCAIFVPIYPCSVLGISKVTFLKASIRVIICIPIYIVICNLIKMNVQVDTWIKFIGACIVSGILLLLVSAVLWLNSNERKKILNFIHNLLKNKI